jgi:hypothetical protein
MEGRGGGGGGGAISGLRFGVDGPDLLGPLTHPIEGPDAERRLWNDLSAYLQLPSTCVPPGVVRCIHSAFDKLRRGTKQARITALMASTLSGATSPLRHALESGIAADEHAAHGGLTWRFPPPRASTPADLGLPAMRCFAAPLSFASDTAWHVTRGSSFNNGEPCSVTAVAVRIQDVEAIDADDARTRTATQVAARRAATVIHDAAMKQHGHPVLVDVLMRVYVFVSPVEACQFSHHVQLALLEADWPRELEIYGETRKTVDEETEAVLWRGVRVAMGAHCASGTGSISWCRDAVSDQCVFTGVGIPAAVALALVAPFGVLALDETIWPQLRHLTAFLDDPHVDTLEWTFNSFITAANATQDGGFGTLPGDDKRATLIKGMVPWTLASRLHQYRAAVADAPAYRGFVDPTQAPAPVPAADVFGTLSLPMDLRVVTKAAAGATMEFRRTGSFVAARHRASSIASAANGKAGVGESALAKTHSQHQLAAERRQSMRRASGLDPAGSSSFMDASESFLGDSVRDPLGSTGGGNARALATAGLGRSLQCPYPLEQLCATTVPLGFRDSHADAIFGGVTATASLPATDAVAVLLVGIAKYELLSAGKAAGDEAALLTMLAPFTSLVKRLMGKYTKAGEGATSMPLAAAKVREVGHHKMRRMLVFSDIHTAQAFAAELLSASLTLTYDVSARSIHQTSNEVAAALQPQRRRGRPLGAGPPIVASLHFMELAPAFSLSGPPRLHCVQRNRVLLRERGLRAGPFHGCATAPLRRRRIVQLTVPRGV